MSGNRAYVPWFRYPLPEIPLAGAVTAIGRVSVVVRLHLHGVLDVQAEERESALAALDSLTGGIFVQGMDSAEPRIISEAGHQFRQLRSERHCAGELSFAGICAMRFMRSHREAWCTVVGEPEYRLEIRAGRPPGAHPDDARHALASIGGPGLVGPRT